MKFQMQVEIPAPASMVWSIVGEQFGEISTWAPGLDTSSLTGNLGIGAIRTCRGSGIGAFRTAGMTTQERLLDFDPDQMTLMYEALNGLPKFIRRAENRWSVSELGPNRCRVTMQGIIELRGLFVLLTPIFPMVLRSVARPVFAALASHAIATAGDRRFNGQPDWNIMIFTLRSP